MEALSCLRLVCNNFCCDAQCIPAAQGACELFDTITYMVQIKKVGSQWAHCCCAALEASAEQQQPLGPRVCS